MMKRLTVEKCWDEISGFWQSWLPEVERREPTWDEKVAYAKRESTGGGDVSDDFLWSKRRKTIQVTEWIDVLARATGEVFWWEIPPRYVREVRDGVAAKRYVGFEVTDNMTQHINPATLDNSYFGGMWWRLLLRQQVDGVGRWLRTTDEITTGDDIARWMQ